MPHRFFVAVPNITKRIPRSRTDTVKMNTMLATWLGANKLIRASNTAKRIISRMAFVDFMR